MVALPEPFYPARHALPVADAEPQALGVVEMLAAHSVGIHGLTVWQTRDGGFQVSVSLDGKLSWTVVKSAGIIEGIGQALALAINARDGIRHHGSVGQWAG